jgi:uncharacterized phage-associated protein
MATVFDVAAYVLGKQGEMTAMKLQKLVYYAQAWSLVWDEEPLFDNPIEAWANGPVTPDLYQAHRGRYRLTREMIRGDETRLIAEQRETIDAVLSFYGGRTSQWLSDLTHSEDPWKNARCGLAPGERGDQVITHATMAEYYGSL